MEARRLRYQPAFDGLRAIAVLAVMLFHAGVAGFGGGYLGVSVFFTLSGYLITRLLIAEHVQTGRIDLVGFYSRRFRRLMPASLLAVGAVTFASLTTDWFDGVRDLRTQVLGSLLQVQNWVLLAGENSYQGVLITEQDARSPLTHFWSLSIEEQFYWIWPPVVIAALWLGRRRFARHHRRSYFGLMERLSTAGRRTQITVTAWILTGLAVVSSAGAPLIAFLWGPDAAYWSTPARIPEVLVGAAAGAWAARGGISKKWCHLGVVGAVVLVGCVFAFPADSGPAYSGALPLVALASMSVVLGAAKPGGLSHALSHPALVSIGRVSYGLYVYHWPIFVVLTPERTGLSWFAVLVLRLVVTFVVAVASFITVERPIRFSWPPARWGGLTAGVGAVAISSLAVVGLVPTQVRYWQVDEAAAARVAIGSAQANDRDQQGTGQQGTGQQGTDEQGTTVPSTTEVVTGSVVPSTGPTTSAPDSATPSTTNSDPTSGVGDGPSSGRPYGPSGGPGGTGGGPTSAQPGGSTAPSSSTSDPATSVPAGAGQSSSDPYVEAVPYSEPDSTVEAVELDRPLRVIVAGDSIAGSIATGLVEWAVAHPGEIEVEDLHVAGCGVVNGGEHYFGGWEDVPEGCEIVMEERIPNAIDELEADVLLVFSSVWDLTDRRWNGVEYIPTDQTYKNRIVSAYRSLIRDSTDAGATSVVLLVGPPTVTNWEGGAPSDDLSRNRALIESYELVDRMSGDSSAVIDFSEFTEDVGLADDREARPDGVHWTPESAEAIVDDYLIDEIFRTAGYVPPYHPPEP